MMGELRRLMALRSGYWAKAEQYEDMAKMAEMAKSGDAGSLRPVAQGLRLAARDVSDQITKLLDEMQKEAA